MDLLEVDVSLVCSYFSSMFKFNNTLGGEVAEKLQFDSLFQVGS